MGCCNFNGQESEAVTEEMLEWVRASGGPRFPMGGPGDFRTAGKSALPPERDCCKNADVCGTDEDCVNCQCSSQRRTAQGGDPWYTTLQGRSAINTSAMRSGPPRYYHPTHKTSPGGGPIGPLGPTIQEYEHFDGAAVKKNWIPLVVLGVSLIIGIGITEWVTKKYIK